MSIFSAGFTPDHHVSNIEISIKDINCSIRIRRPTRNRATHEHMSQVAVTSQSPSCAAQEPGDFRLLLLAVQSTNS
jgi:hypothetical protein